MNSFWNGKRILLTGHTGFKGGWMAAWLSNMGAKVTGYGLEPSTSPSFFELCGMGSHVESVIGDIRNSELLARTFVQSKPEIVLHLAAQPLVRRSYREPLETLDVNIMGTAHVLEACRAASGVRTVLVVTSDKCYQNRGWLWGYREDEAMGGSDPYSASKGCTELVAAAYQHSFFRWGEITLATARAGNVIGGGDWSEDRLVPDAIRSLGRGEALIVRNPRSVRPWQHVLEPLSGYLLLAEKAQQGGWNFGPDESGAVSVARLSDLIVKSWGGSAAWKEMGDPNAPHEEAYLKLDSSKARQMLGWRPRLSVAEAVDWTVDWYKKALNDPAGGMFKHTEEQISRYEAITARDRL